jgi:hypothetical protein
MNKPVTITCSLIVLAIGGCTTLSILGTAGNPKYDRAAQKQVEVKKVPYSVKTYDENVIDYIPTEKGQGYDKTLEFFGIKRIKEINGLMPIVASIFANRPNCDKLAFVGVSQHHSRKDNAVFFGITNLYVKFYITEEDLKAKMGFINVGLTKGYITDEDINAAHEAGCKWIKKLAEDIKATKGE